MSNTQELSLYSHTGFGRALVHAFMCVCVCVCKQKTSQYTNSQKLFLSQVYKLGTCFLMKEFMKDAFPGFSYSKLNKSGRQLNCYRFSQKYVVSCVLLNFRKCIWSYWIIPWRPWASLFLSCWEIEHPHSLYGRCKVLSMLVPIQLLDNQQEPSFQSKGGDDVWYTLGSHFLYFTIHTHMYV